MSKKKKSTVYLGTEKCVFCGSSEDNEAVYGQCLIRDGLFVHYFCMLFASGLCQNGKSDSSGILGFLAEDIIQEVKRANRLRCVYCSSGGASIGCLGKACRKSYHFGCGVKQGVLFQFYDCYQSYCQQHRPTQSLDQWRASPQKPHIPEENLCSVCMCDVTHVLDNDTLKGPCCRDSWFHRECLQRYATSSGLYYFKCPLCNNKDQFQQEMLEFGIYIPDQDAAWEREQNAFAELLERHGRCDEVKCLCPKGRNYDKDDSKWEIILCQSCGAHGGHIGCVTLPRNGVFHCPDCAEITARCEAKKSEKSKAEKKAKKQSALCTAKMKMKVTKEIPKYTPNKLLKTCASLTVSLTPLKVEKYGITEIPESSDCDTTPLSKKKKPRPSKWSRGVASSSKKSVVSRRIDSFFKVMPSEEKKQRFALTKKLGPLSRRNQTSTVTYPIDDSTASASTSSARWESGLGARNVCPSTNQKTRPTPTKTLRSNSGPGDLVAFHADCYNIVLPQTETLFAQTPSEWSQEKLESLYAGNLIKNCQPTKVCSAPSSDNDSMGSLPVTEPQVPSDSDSMGPLPVTQLQAPSDSDSIGPLSVTEPQVPSDSDSMGPLPVTQTQAPSDSDSIGPLPVTEPQVPSDSDSMGPLPVTEPQAPSCLTVQVDDDYPYLKSLLSKVQSKKLTHSPSKLPTPNSSNGTALRGTSTEMALSNTNNALTKPLGQTPTKTLRSNSQSEELVAFHADFNNMVVPQTPTLFSKSPPKDGSPCSDTGNEVVMLEASDETFDCPTIEVLQSKYETPVKTLRSNSQAGGLVAFHADFNNMVVPQTPTLFSKAPPKDGSPCSDTGNEVVMLEESDETFGCPTIGVQQSTYESPVKTLRSNSQAEELVAFHADYNNLVVSQTPTLFSQSPAKCTVSCLSPGNTVVPDERYSACKNSSSAVQQKNQETPKKSLRSNAQSEDLVAFHADYTNMVVPQTSTLFSKSPVSCHSSGNDVAFEGAYKEPRYFLENNESRMTQDQNHHTPIKLMTVDQHLDDVVELQADQPNMMVTADSYAENTTGGKTPSKQHGNDFVFEQSSSIFTSTSNTTPTKDLPPKLQKSPTSAAKVLRSNSKTDELVAFNAYRQDMVVSQSAYLFSETPPKSTMSAPRKDGTNVTKELLAAEIGDSPSSQNATQNSPMHSSTPSKLLRSNSKSNDLVAFHADFPNIVVNQTPTLFSQPADTMQLSHTQPREEVSFRKTSLEIGNQPKSKRALSLPPEYIEETIKNRRRRSISLESEKKPTLRARQLSSEKSIIIINNPPSQTTFTLSRDFDSISPGRTVRPVSVVKPLEQVLNDDTVREYDSLGCLNNQVPLGVGSCTQLQQYGPNNNVKLVRGFSLNNNIESTPEYAPGSNTNSSQEFIPLDSLGALDHLSITSLSDVQKSMQSSQWAHPGVFSSYTLVRNTSVGGVFRNKKGQFRNISYAMRHGSSANHQGPAGSSLKRKRSRDMDTSEYIDLDAFMSLEHDTYLTPPASSHSSTTADNDPLGTPGNNGPPMIPYHPTWGQQAASSVDRGVESSRVGPCVYSTANPGQQLMNLPFSSSIKDWTLTSSQAPVNRLKLKRKRP